MNAAIHSDGRLYEPPGLPPLSITEKSPALAMGLSLVPGLGRAYAGRPVDGLYSFVLVGGFAASSYGFHQNQG